MITITDEKGRRSTYLRQYRVSTTCDGKTVTGSTVLTEVIWHGLPMTDDGDTGDWHVIAEIPRAPRGLPLIDQSQRIGTPWGVDPVPQDSFVPAPLS